MFMTSFPGRRKPAFGQRLRTHPNSILVSLAGLFGRSVYDRRGQRVGRVRDLVVALGKNGDRAPLVGILVGARRQVVFIPYTAIAGILRWEVYLTTSGLQPHPIPDQDGVVTLAGDLLDHRITDAGGVGIGRVSDLVLVCMIDEILLVGADVSIPTFLRRAGSPWMRRRVTARRIYDWATISAQAARGSARRTQSSPGPAPSVEIISTYRPDRLAEAPILRRRYD
jgi:sporulation protein YlmC with PRC-barrel domain